MPRLSVKSRRRLIRFSLFTVNAALLVSVIGFVLRSPSTPSNNTSVSLSGDSEGSVVLDQVSSADIAVNVARLTRLPEATSVTNQADSVNFELTSLQSDSSVIAKPLVLSSTLPSRKDIQVYKTKSGDTLDSIASKFGVSSNSVRWSNNLNTSTVPVGKTLYLPPAGFNGIVYKVKSGDTAESIARKYNASKDLIIAYNDAEINGLPFGERIFIPDGSIVTTVSSTPRQFAFNVYPRYGYNGYDYGWCTWYVASKVTMPANWGNANTWDNYAAAGGWVVSARPTVGAIAQTDAGGLGHVGIVEAVSDDGTMIKYSDMNGLAGWGRVGYSGWVPANSKFQKFIYR